MTAPTEPAQVSAFVTDLRQKRRIQRAAAKLFVSRVWNDMSMTVVASLLATVPATVLWLAGVPVPFLGVLGPLLAFAAGVGMTQLLYWIGRDTALYFQREARAALADAQHAADLQDLEEIRRNAYFRRLALEAETDKETK